MNPTGTLLTPERRARDSAAWRNTTIAREAWKKAAEHPDAVAFYMENEPDVSFGQIALAARRLITALQSLGLRAGEVISFQLPNWPEAAAIDIAAAALGLVVNPIVPIYREITLGHPSPMQRFLVFNSNTVLMLLLVLALACPLLSPLLQDLPSQAPPSTSSCASRTFAPQAVGW